MSQEVRAVVAVKQGAPVEVQMIAAIRAALVEG